MNRVKYLDDVKDGRGLKTLSLSILATWVLSLTILFGLAWFTYHCWRVSQGKEDAKKL